jgi:2'-5' RNA ligase
LFTALWPSAEAVHALHAELTAHPDWPPEGWRPLPTPRWHVTLCFHGEDDAGVLARRLEARAEGLAAPWLRLAGSVSLPRVAAVGVLPAGADLARPGPLDPAAGPDAQALAALVSAAGAEPARFLPHVTVARTGRRRDGPPAAGPLARHQGPWWHPEEVCLVLSEPTSAGSRYSVLHRVPLVARASARPRPDAPRGGDPRARPARPASARG